MKICIIQEAGRHQENKNYREALCLQRAFDRHPDVLGTIVYGKGYPAYSQAINFDSFDIIVMLENYSSSMVPNLAHTRNPMKFVWSIDSHVMDVHPHKKIFESGKYDYFLQATSIFCDRVPNSIWFPNAYDDSLFYPKETTKKHFVGFCGSKLNREGICNRLREKTDFIPDYWVLGEAMCDTIRAYTIHFNLNYNWDVNYRNFETCGLGVALLTNNNMNPDDYYNLGFRHGINCLFWDSKNEQSLFDVIEEYKGKDEELKEIAKRGNVLVSSHHTYYNRVCELIDLKKGSSINDVYAKRKYTEHDS